MSEDKMTQPAKLVPAAIDVDHLRLIRENIRAFMRHAATRYVAPGARMLLDIAPQDHEGARPFFASPVSIETLDIDGASGATYVADICQCNDRLIAAETFDYVVCTEVLEHTLRPFDAVREIHRILKPGGRLFLSVPFNLRIHGPLPDCWRFTEHGLRAILDAFDILELQALETPQRPLMPVQYTVVAQKTPTGRGAT